MNNPEFNTTEFKEKIKKGLDLTFKKLLEEKRQKNGEFIFSRNGKIVKIKARDITD
jgi:hypothetical protein